MKWKERQKINLGEGDRGAEEEEKGEGERKVDEEREQNDQAQRKEHNEETEGNEETGEDKIKNKNSNEKTTVTDNGYNNRYRRNNHGNNTMSCQQSQQLRYLHECNTNFKNRNNSVNDKTTTITTSCIFIKLASVFTNARICQRYLQG